MNVQRSRSRSNLSPYRSYSEKSIPSQDDRLPFIVPKIVEELVEHTVDSDPEAEHVDPEDNNQHYFTDQVKFPRPRWQRPWFCCVTMSIAAIDMSAVSSFPSKVATHGGAAFLIVYFLTHALMTFPLMYLEGLLGQYFQISTVGVWGICPIFKCLVSGLYLYAFIFAAFNPTVVAWACYMFYESFLSLTSLESYPLPWIRCDNPWNTCICNGERNLECPELNGTEELRNPSDEYFVAAILKVWKTKYGNPDEITSVTENGNPNISYGFGNEKEGLGRLRRHSTSIVAAIALIILCVNSMRYKVAGHLYTFTTVFPLIVLTLLICRGATLDGGMLGVWTYMQPNFTVLQDEKVWISAAQAAVLSMGVGNGVHLTIASWNPLHANLHQDVLCAVLLDTLTSLMGCVVSFSFVGNLYIKKGKEIPKRYPGEGFLFPFTLFPYAVSEISGSTFFSTLYYFMIVLMATDTCIIFQQILSYSLYEDYRRKYPKQKVSPGTFRCVAIGFAFILGVMSVTRGGYWLVAFRDNFFFTMFDSLYPLSEAIAISWIWGLENLSHATEVTSGRRPSLYLRLCWKFFVPAFFILNLYAVFSSLDFSPIQELGLTAPEGSRLFAKLVAFGPMVLLGFSLIRHTLRQVRNAKGHGFCTVLMLLLSPEYEHDEIKADVRSAKRLKLGHYLFLRYQDEVDNSPTCKLLKGLCASLKRCCSKKNAVGPDSGSGPEGNQDGEQKHRHRHHHHGYKKLSDNVWGMWDKIQKRFSKQPAEDTLMPAPPQPNPEMESGTTPADLTIPTRIGSVSVDKEQQPPPPPPLPASKVRSRTELAQSQSNTSLASTGSRGQRERWKH